MNSGIYKIKNIINGKSYIGSAFNIEKRWKRHLYELKNNKHHNPHLQRAFNKYGLIKFKFEIIEYCQKDKLFEKENFYLKNKENLYNISIQAIGGDNLSNNPNKNEIIKKIKHSINLKMKNMSISEKKNNYGLTGKENGMFGKNHSIETIKKISKNNKNNKNFHGKKHSKYSKNKISKDKKLKYIGINNPFHGKNHNKETKRKISKNKKGKYFGKQNKEFIINNKEYKSLSEASNELNIHITTISYRLRSKNFVNYTYKK